MTIVNGGIINTGGGGSSSSSSTNAVSDGLACFTGSFSGVTTTSISHNLNSSALVVEFKDSLGNLLIPDTWSITNANVIEADFSPAATGDVTIVACITSGLAAITGGVTTIEGLSGIVDLDSSNGSILITTSGQVINLNAIFTPASGAVLEQKCRDIDILSGLIDAGGGGGGGVSTINGISGTITLTSTNNGLEVGLNGQSIEFTPLFTYTSGQIIDQHSQDLLTLSGLILSDGGQTSVEGVSGVIDLEGLDGTMVITVDGQTIQLSGLYNPTSGLIIDQHSVDLLTLSGLIGTGGGSDAGQTSVNGLSGTLTLTSPDGTILIGDGPQAIHLSGLFTATSGALLQQHSQDLLTLSGLIIDDAGQTSINGLSGVVAVTSPDGSVLIGDSPQTLELSGLFTTTSGALLQQKCADIDILSGLVVNHTDSGQTSIQGLSGVVALDSPNDTISIVVNGQTVELDGIFTWASGQLLESLADASGVQSLNNISGIIDLVAANNGVTVTDNGQVIELTTLFTYASGQLVDQNTQDILTVSGLLGGGDSGQTSVNGLSGTLVLTSPDGSILIGDGPQAIQLSGLFTQASGAVLQQHSEDLLTLSGLIPGGAGGNGQTSINGLSGVTFLTSPDGSILIGDNGQAIEISGLFTAASGATLQQKCEDVLALSGTVTQNTADINGVDARLISLSGLTDGLPRTQTSLDGLSGVLLLDSPDGTILIGQDGQTIELSGLFTQASGAVLEQHTQDLVDLSGLIFSDGGQTTVNGLSGTISISGVNLQVTTSGQTILVSGIMNAASGAILEQRGRDIDTLSGLIIDDAGQTSINGLSGVIDITSPDGSVGIAVNGQSIELTVDTSGACLVGEFAPSDGTLFTVTHGLNTEDFTWNMWRTDTSPHTTMFGNVAPSGLNHAVVELATPVSGKVVIQGCSVGGTSSAESFSTTEALTGGLWIDDKPIYKKTISVGAGPINSTVLTAHGITGVDTWIKFDWMMFNTANTVARMLPQPEANPVVFLQGAIVGSDLFMNTGVGGDWSDYTGHCTIYYTKT